MLERSNASIEGDTSNVREVREDRHTIKAQPWYVKGLLYLTVVCISLFLFTIVALLLPFEPYHFYGWKAIPPKVCPLDPLHTYYKSEVVAGPYTIGGLEGTATVINESDHVVDSWDIEIKDLEPHAVDVRPSVVVRSAPIEPGVYRLGLQDMHVPGRMLYLVPDHQEFSVVSDDTFEVLSLTDKACKHSSVLKVATGGGK